MKVCNDDIYTSIVFEKIQSEYDGATKKSLSNGHPVLSSPDSSITSNKHMTSSYSDQYQANHDRAINIFIEEIITIFSTEH